MRRFWLFRSNLKDLEYYHSFKDLEIFEKYCHDYYLLLPLWLLKKDFFDEVVIWRLTKFPRDEIVFEINSKKFIQRWVSDFKLSFYYPKPDISFWRGGFPEYDEVTKIRPEFFGKKLYLGAGQRQFSYYNGKYDVYLIEDERDFNSKYNCLPFYKTASPYIFHPVTCGKTWDICWPCNFTQIRYKGQEFFIKKISEDKKLQTIKIVHCGNRPDKGQKLAKKYGVKSIEFVGPVNRIELNTLLNSSKFGLNLSNRIDGCPRISTEILMSGTPLISRDTVRLLKYYKKNKSVITTTDNDLSKNILSAIENYEVYKNAVLQDIKLSLSFENISQKNIDTWQKI